MIYINPYLSVPINTIIGGVAGTISTKAALATKLGISESIITRFQIVGSDVHARIQSSYAIPDYTWTGDLSLKKYIDIEGKVTRLGEESLRGTGLEEISFLKTTHSEPSSLIDNNFLIDIDMPSLIFISGGLAQNSTSIKSIKIIKLVEIIVKSNVFYNLTACELIDMRSLKVYGQASTGYTVAGSGFANLKLGCEIRVHEFLKTADAGNPNRSLNWVKANRGAIVKFYDDNGNYVSTL